VCINKTQRASHNAARALRKGTNKAEDLLKPDLKAAARISALLKALSDADLAKEPFTLGAASARGGDGKWAKCEESYYRNADPSGATAAWLLGEGQYDIDAGKPKPTTTGDTDDDKKKIVTETALAKAFMRAVWKSADTVAFGFRKDVLVAWYCPAAGATIDLDSTTKAKDNIKKSCVRGSPDGEKLANNCYNERALKKHQEYRATHFSYNAITVDYTRASVLQGLLDAKTAAGTKITKDADIAIPAADADKCF
jgi:hypothetical protein